MLWLDGDYLELLQKAYETINTESARANYEEEWQEIQKQNEQNQNGQNDYRQNQYEQNEYEQNQHGQNNYEQNMYGQNQQIEVVNSKPIVQQSQSKREIQFTPIMTESSKQKTEMRKIKKRIHVVNGKQTYTGPQLAMITLTRPTEEENQKSSKDDIQFMPITAESSRQRIDEQVKKIQQTQPAKESLLKKVLGMINNEKVNTNDLIQEVKEDAEENKINEQQENVADRADEDEDMQL